MKNSKKVDPNVLTETERTLAIAAGMIGGRFDRMRGVIILESGFANIHYNEAGELIIHFDVNQNDKWKETYRAKIKNNYADKTALVNRIIASKGKSL